MSCLPRAPGGLAAPFPSSHPVLCHREREEDKEMAEFLQSKISKSYLQRAGGCWQGLFLALNLPGICPLSQHSGPEVLLPGLAHLEEGGEMEQGMLVVEIPL